jgi:hypothetical protein
MAIDPTLLTLIQELFAEYDSNLDTSSGSPLRTQVIDPFLNRVGGSPLDVDLEAFLVSRLETEIDDVDVSPFSAMRDLAIRAFTVMAEPLQREIEGVKLTQSLNNFQSMTRAELNALLGNYFTSLQEGLKASGTVRMFFPSPQSVTVTPATQFSTGGGLNFFPLTVQTISSTQMSFQQEGNLYFFDVLVQAENSGEAYNVDIGEISSVSGIGSVTRVTNRSRFRNALNEETKEEAVARTQNSITIRNLITERGVGFVIPANFKETDTLQVIGYGDPEMLRDVVKGPTEISDIPGGISGRDDLDLVLGESIHIGGQTDVYVYQLTPDEEDIDLENVTDKGFRVYAGKHGFTDPGGATSSFKDDFGFFQTRGVLPGDILLLGEDAFVVAGVTAEDELDISPSTLDGGLFEQTYEVVRQQAGLVTIPLYDLVATDDSGSVVLAPSGNPVAPVPGSPTNDSLLDSSSALVEKLENISLENVELPLLRVTTVEFLDPLTKEPLGQTIPMKDLVLARAPEAFTGGTVSATATGTIRLYFRDALRCYTNAATSFVAQDGRTYLPLPIASGGNAEVLAAGNDITVAGVDLTSLIAVGDNFIIIAGLAAGEYTVVGTAFVAGDTIVTVREILPVETPQAYTVYPGILQSNMSQESDTNLFFFDVNVFDTLVGVAGNKPEGTVFTGAGVVSEGWTLKSTKSVLSYSTRDLPYIQLTEWVNDDTELFVTFTAPAIRISYEYAGNLQAIQEFADGVANRVVSEDVLIRHFVPSYVRTQLSVRDLTEDESKEVTVSFINNLDPTEDLEVSDLDGALREAGSTKVMMPVTLVALTQNRDRTWTGTFDQDALTSSRIQHFIADEDFILTSVEP